MPLTLVVHKFNFTLGARSQTSSDSQSEALIFKLTQ